MPTGCFRRASLQHHAEAAFRRRGSMPHCNRDREIERSYCLAARCRQCWFAASSCRQKEVARGCAPRVLPQCTLRGTPYGTEIEPSGIRLRRRRAESGHETGPLMAMSSTDGPPSDRRGRRVVRSVRDLAVDELPVLPGVVVRLMGLSPSSAQFFEEVLTIAREDPGLALRVIRAANSRASRLVEARHRGRDRVSGDRRAPLRRRHLDRARLSRRAAPRHRPLHPLRPSSGVHPSRRREHTGRA